MSSSKAEFDKYASQGFNRIPLMREVLADLGHAPCPSTSSCARAAVFLFEVGPGRREVGRYPHHRPAGAPVARQRP